MTRLRALSFLTLNTSLHSPSIDACRLHPEREREREREREKFIDNQIDDLRSVSTTPLVGDTAAGHSCVCVREREREREKFIDNQIEREREREREREPDR